MNLVHKTAHIQLKFLVSTCRNIVTYKLTLYCFENQSFVAIILRIEFTPVVEIGVNRGHYFTQETTNEGPTLINA